MIYDTPYLLDAITAVAKRQRSHLQPSNSSTTSSSSSSSPSSFSSPEDYEVLQLKARSLSAFHADLTRPRSSNCRVLISTILVLISLEYAGSAYSDQWTIHLNGAYRIMETHGGVGLAEHDSTMRSQLAMLLWYDTTAALLSRNGPSFPRRYAEALMNWRRDSEWSLMALNGFPDSLFLDIFDIADAAAAARTVAGPQKSASDNAVAQELEARVWNLKVDATADRDVAGLVDCWRLTLLLYCARAFRRHEESGAEARRAILAEEILWLVLSLPPDSMLQKQCLLPVVLAGCEMPAEKFRFRCIATEFCTRWNQATGLWVFSSALHLLERVWGEMDSDSSVGEVWWGSVVSPRTSHGYLFG